MFKGILPSYSMHFCLSKEEGYLYVCSLYYAWRSLPVLFFVFIFFFDFSDVSPPPPPPPPKYSMLYAWAKKTASCTSTPYTPLNVHFLSFFVRLIFQMQARLTGEAMSEQGLTVSHVYSSPALRCVQTADGILKGMGAEPTLKIKVGGEIV